MLENKKCLIHMFTMSFGDTLNTIGLAAVRSSLNHYQLFYERVFQKPLWWSIRDLAVTSNKNH